ncbi:MAG: hypothetical protein ABI591_20905 [Kofleriaceae bacterium]
MSEDDNECTATTKQKRAARRAVLAGAATLVLGYACVAPITNSTGESTKAITASQSLQRCNDLRSDRDLFRDVAAGASVVAGAGGITSLGYTNPDHQRYVAIGALTMGVLGAVFVALGTNTANAFTDEGCTERFEALRKEVAATVKDAGPAEAGGSGGSGGSGHAN